MSVNPEQIAHISKLARLRVAPEHVGAFTDQFNTIIEYVAKLDDANTDGVAPMTSVFENTTELRPDVPGPMLSQAEALMNAPRKTEGFFSVPRVIEG